MHRSRVIHSLLLPPFTLLSAVVAVVAASSAVDFDRANRLYDQGQFQAAVKAYEAVLAADQASPALYYNLGNAHFKAGHLGQAVLNYRRAEQLAPRDPDIQANLRFARQSLAGNVVPQPPAWRRWACRLTLNEWTVLTAPVLWLCVGLVVLRRVRPELGIQRWLALAALAGLFCGAGLSLDWYERFQTVHAVVVARDAVLRYGPLDESQSLQPLQDGQELVVIEQKGKWLKVEGAARGVGWLRQEQVACLSR